MQFVVGDLEWVGFFWLLGGERGGGSPVFSLVSPLTQRQAEQVRGAHRSPVLNVSVVMQLKFLQYYENVEVYQIPFLVRVLQIPVVLQRRVRAV